MLDPESRITKQERPEKEGTNKHQHEQHLVQRETPPSLTTTGPEKQHNYNFQTEAC